MAAATSDVTARRMGGQTVLVTNGTSGIGQSNASSVPDDTDAALRFWQISLDLAGGTTGA
jgi:hypothetical protein